MDDIELFLYKYLPLPLYWVLRGFSSLLPANASNLRRRLAIDIPYAPRHATIWLHAASVGEISTIAPLVEEVRQRFPNYPLVVTTMTTNGMKRALSLLESTQVGLLPLDFLPSIRKTIEILKPRTLIIGETEIWPNLVTQTHSYGAKIVLVNGRISLKSLRWYRLFGRLIRRVLRDFDYFLMRTHDDADRIKSLGAPDERVQVAGNTKFDVLPKPIPEEARRELKEKLGIPPERAVLTLGSIRDGEMEILIDALASAIRSSKVLVIVAPRHLNTLPAIRAVIDSHGFTYGEIDSTRPFGAAEASSLDFLLLGQMGRLLEMYAIADIAIVGGTFRPFGGHNPLEPASQGTTTIVGPYNDNIADDIQYLKSYDCVLVCEPSTLGKCIIDLLRDKPKREKIASSAIEAIRTKKGIASRCVDIMLAKGLLPEQ